MGAVADNSGREAKCCSRVLNVGEVDYARGKVEVHPGRTVNKSWLGLVGLVCECEHVALPQWVPARVEETREHCR